MKIIIAGAGEVGFNLAKHLSKEDYGSTVIDINPKKCLRIQNTIDAIVIDASEGISKESGLYISYGKETILSAGITGEFIPLGCGTLIDIEFDGVFNGIDNIVVGDTNANETNFEYYDCSN